MEKSIFLICQMSGTIICARVGEYSSIEWDYACDCEIIRSKEFAFANSLASDSPNLTFVRLDVSRSSNSCCIDWLIGLSGGSESSIRAASSGPFIPFPAASSATV